MLDRSRRRWHRVGSMPSRRVRTRGSCRGSSRRRRGGSRRSLAPLRSSLHRERERRPRSRESPAGVGRAAVDRRWCAGSRSCGAGRSGRGPRGRAATCRRRRTALQAGTSEAIPRASAVRARRCAASTSGTWCARNVPSIRLPSSSFGPVHPLGVRSTMHGHAGRRTSPDRARSLISAISSKTSSMQAASAWCTSVGSDPSTNQGRWP